MPANSYDIGDVIRLAVTLTQDGEALDPGALSVVIRRPDGVKLTYVYGTDAQVERTGVGTYRCDVTAAVPGAHWYRWVSTGDGAAAGEDRFLVKPANALE